MPMDTLDSPFNGFANDPCERNFACRPSPTVTVRSYPGDFISRSLSGNSDNSISNQKLIIRPNESCNWVELLPGLKKAVVNVLFREPTDRLTTGKSYTWFTFWICDANDCIRKRLDVFLKRMQFFLGAH